MEKLTLFALALSLMGPPQTQPADRDLRKAVDDTGTTAVTARESSPQTQPADNTPPKLALEKGDRIVAIGDSITQAGGYLRAMDAVLAGQYPDLEIPPIINVGISGHKAEDLLPRFQKDVLDKKPDIVTISIGINDVWHRLKDPHDEAVLEAYARNVEKMVRMARDAGAQVYLLAPTVIEEKPDAKGNQRLKRYIAAGKKIARRQEITYVDLHHLFLTVIANAEEKKVPHEPGKLLTTDGVHMKPLGDTVMAAGILRAMGVPDEKIAATSLEKIFPDWQQQMGLSNGQ